MSIEDTAAREKETLAARVGLPDVELGMDDLDKTIDQKWGDDEDYMTAKDPMLDCVNRFKADYGARANGFSFKFFAPAVAGELGVENYEKCLDKQGNAYTVGEMWMGMIPTRIANKRLQKARQESDDAVAESTDRFEEQVARLRSEAKGLGLEVVAPGDVMTGNAGTDPRSRGQQRESGFSVRRGVQG